MVASDASTKDTDQTLESSRRHVWAAVLPQVKTGITKWNRKFLPTDGRRIALDEIEDRMLTLTSRSAAVTATISQDGREIALVGRHQLDIGHAWRDSIQVAVNSSGQVELRQAGSKTSPGEFANQLINKTAKWGAATVA